MAIAYDNSTSFRAYTGYTTNYTTASGAQMFVVTGSNCVSITYGGVSLTNIISYDPAIDSNSVPINIWYLASPASGSNEFAFTASGSASVGVSVITYTGVRSSQPETNNNQTAHGGSPDASTQVVTFTSSVTTITNNAWAVTFIVGGNNSPRTFTAGTNTTARTSQGSLLAESTGILDSGGVVSPAGSRSLVSNWSSGSGFVSTVTLSIAPQKTGGGFMILLK